MRSLLAEEIAARGPLAFPDFMKSALYHPRHGYYARGAANIGASGDFFTSVSVGPLFGQLLARRFLGFYAADGRPPRWRIVESGADTGALARDLLAAIDSLDPAAGATLEYAIVEPLDALREVQREALRDFSPRVRQVAAAAELAADPLPGLAFGNELLDALPFHVIERHEGRWLECRVAHQPASGFRWQLAEIDDPALATATAAIKGRFPDGYRSEVRTGYRGFLAPLADCLEQGRMVWIDYGFAHADYYHPSRTQGTLRTFLHHHAGDDPLDDPGSRDISAHVDFTAVAEAAAALGGAAVDFRSQGLWLTEAARDWLAAMEGKPDPALIARFQTLTHPSKLGGAFHVLELSWRENDRPRDRAGLQHRLFPQVE